MRGKTSEEEKKQKIDNFVAMAGVIPLPLDQQKLTLSLQVSARCDLLNYEAFNASLSTPNTCDPPYLEYASHSFKIFTLLNK